MEFTIVAGDFAKVLGLVKGAVSDKTTIPILNNVCVEAKAGAIALTGTNMAMQTSATDVCEVVAPGVTTVRADALFSLVKSMPAKKLATMKVDGGRATLSCGRSTYTLGTLPPDDFPQMETVADGATFDIGADDLLPLIEATKNTTLGECERDFYQQGIYAWTDDGRLVLASTDGKYLSEITRDRPAGLGNLEGAIIPNKAVAAILGLLTAFKGRSAKVAINKRRISVDFGAASLIAKLIEANYADYRRIVPVGGSPSFIVDAGQILEAIERLEAVLYAQSSNNKVPVAVFHTTDDGTVEIAGQNVGADLGIESVDADVRRPTIIGADAKRLSKLLQMWPAAARLEFSTLSRVTPILITSPDVPDLRQVIMPMSPGQLALRKPGHAALQHHQAAEAA